MDTTLRIALARQTGNETALIARASIDQLYVLQYAANDSVLSVLGGLCKHSATVRAVAESSWCVIMVNPRTYLVAACLAVAAAALRPGSVVFVGQQALVQVQRSDPELTFKPLGSAAKLTSNGSVATFVADTPGRFVIDNQSAVDAIPSAPSGTAPAPWLASALVSSSWMTSIPTASDLRPDAWDSHVQGDCVLESGTSMLSITSSGTDCKSGYLVSTQSWSPFRGGLAVSANIPAPGAGGTIVFGFSAARDSLTRDGTARIDPFAPLTSCWGGVGGVDSDQHQSLPGICQDSILAAVTKSNISILAPAPASELDGEVTAGGLVVIASVPREKCDGMVLEMTVNVSTAALTQTCTGDDAQPRLEALHGVNWQTFGANTSMAALQPDDRPYLWDSAYAGEAAVFVGLVPDVQSTADVHVGRVQAHWGDEIASQARLPAVMLPVADETGVYAETDLGMVQDMATDLPRQSQSDPSHGDTTVSDWFGARGGILDATLAPFHADNTGKTDATKAIQSAVEFARVNYMVVWLPAGDYMVTSTIVMQQTPRLQANGSPSFNFTTNYCWTRFVPNVIVGAANDPSGRRTRLIIPPSTPLFSDADKPQAVIYFHTINSDGKTQSNINMAQGLTSVDIVVGAGNNGAVGVHLRSAQGSSLEDVTVDMTEGGLTGIEGLPGSGGSDSHVTVIGGSWGIDARTTQPSATLSAATLIGQTCTALIHEGSETLVAVGLNVSLAHDVAGPAIVSAGAITGSMVGCNLPQPASVPNQGTYREATPSSLETNLAHSGQLSLIDSVIDANSAKFDVALLVQASLVLSGAYFTGATTAVHLLPMLNSTQAFTINSTAGRQGWVAADLAALADNAPSDGHYQYDTTGYVDGARVSGNPVLLSVRNGDASVAAPPDGLVQSHHWGTDGNALVFDAQGAFSVKDAPYGAVGDGYADDTAAIQAAVAEAAERVNKMVARMVAGPLDAPMQAVLLPRGVYRVSQTILVPPGVALIGVAKHLSVLVTAPGGLTGSVPLPGSVPAAVIHVAGSAVLPPSAIGFLSVTVPEHLANVSAMMFEAAGRVHGSRVPTESDRSHHNRLHAKASYSMIGTSTKRMLPKSRLRSRQAILMNKASHAPDSVHRRTLYRNCWQHRWNLCGSTWDQRCSLANSQAPLLQSAMVTIAGVGGFGLPPIAFYTFFLEDYLLEGPGARHLLVLNATAGGELPPAVSTPAFACYHCNTEHGRGDTMLEVAASEGVRIYGIKSEGNFNVLSISSSSNVSMYGFGGNAAAFPLKQGYPSGYKQFTPSVFRVEDSEGIFLGNINGQPRYSPVNQPCGFPGCPYDPSEWSMIAVFNNSEAAVIVTPPLGRPVAYASSGLI